MKAASGELNLTVITLIAIAAVSTFFLIIFWPKLQNAINNQWKDISETNKTTTTYIVK